MIFCDLVVGIQQSETWILATNIVICNPINLHKGGCVWKIQILHLYYIDDDKYLAGFRDTRYPTSQASLQGKLDKCDRFANILQEYELAMSWNRLKSPAIQQKHANNSEFPHIPWNPLTFHGNPMSYPPTFLPKSSCSAGSCSGLGGGAPGAELRGISLGKIPRDDHHFSAIHREIMGMVDIFPEGTYYVHRENVPYHGIMAKLRNHNGNIIGFLSGFCHQLAEGV